MNKIRNETEGRTVWIRKLSNRITFRQPRPGVPEGGDYDKVSQNMSDSIKQSVARV